MWVLQTCLAKGADKVFDRMHIRASCEFFCQVRVAEFNESTSFREQLEAVSSTGVYVSVHTSNLVRSAH